MVVWGCAGMVRESRYQQGKVLPEQTAGRRPTTVGAIAVVLGPQGTDRDQPKSFEPPFNHGGTVGGLGMGCYGRWAALSAANGAVGRPFEPIHSTLPPPFVAVVPGDANNKDQRRPHLRRAGSEGEYE